MVGTTTSKTFIRVIGFKTQEIKLQILSRMDLFLSVRYSDQPLMQGLRPIYRGLI
jgi:hypothetical protein